MSPSSWPGIKAANAADSRRGESRAGARSAPTMYSERIADALERLAPPPPAAPDFAAADAFVWHPDGRGSSPVPRVNRVEMSLLKGIDRVRDILVENTERFARGLPANNALLWGARGMGKSSLVKAVARRGQRRRIGGRPASSSSKSTARTSRACPS